MTDVRFYTEEEIGDISEKLDSGEGLDSVCDAVCHMNFSQIIEYEDVDEFESLLGKAVLCGRKEVVEAMFNRIRFLMSRQDAGEKIEREAEENAERIMLEGLRLKSFA